MTFTHLFTQDLQQDVTVRQCGGVVFNADNNSNVISVKLYDGGEPAQISGTVVGAVIRSDGLTVPLEGSASDNTASIILTAECFAVPGQIGVGVQILDGDAKTTVLKAVYSVELADTGNVPSGGDAAASVAELVQEIQAAIAQIPADYSALSADVRELQNYVTPGVVLLKNILVTDFTEITIQNRKIYKRGNSIYVKIAGANSNGVIISLSGNAVRPNIATPSTYTPNIGNLLPMSMYNPLTMAVLNKPDVSTNACRIAVYFYTVENDVITRLSNSIGFDLDANVNKLLRAGALPSAVTQNATHFEIVLYIRTAQGLPTDSYTHLILGLDPVAEVTST